MMRILAALALASAIAISGFAQAQTLKLGTLAPAGSPWDDVIRDIAAQWKVDSGGSIQVRIYPGGVVGDEPDMIRKMRVNQLQMAALSGAGLARIAPEIQALQMPMMFDSYEELDYVRDRLAPKLEAILEARGFKVLNWSDVGWVHYFSQRRLVWPKDLQPLKVFTWEGDPVYLEVMQAMGFNPVAMAATDIYTGLQSGLISAFPATPIAALSYQWFGLAPHMCEVKWAPLVGALVISTKAWQAIPDKLKPVLEATARGEALAARDKIRELEDGAVVAMQSHGLMVDASSPEALAAWRTLAQAAEPKLVGKVVPASMIAEVERLRDEYRATKQNP
jgi:TRAP-type C4-dicarboxylate transport system substrate-binding protein